MEISSTKESLVLQLLGSPQVLISGQTVQDLTSIKSQAILYYLAMDRRSKSRLALAGLLWPQKSDTQARVNLRQALRRLRLSVGEYLITSRDSVELDIRQPIQVDAILFETLARSGLEGDIFSLQRAITLYGGDFLSTFYVDDAPDFEDWIILERERLRNLALQGLQRLSNYYVDQGEVVQGLQATRRLLAIEPWHEDSYRNMMRLLALDGQVSSALVQYETCRQVLKAELGVEPAPETTTLYEQIRDGKYPVLELRHEGATDIGPALPAHNLPRQFTSFVGRYDDLAQLDEWLDDPNCALLTIRGPGGVGKTRLAIEIGRQRLVKYPNGVWFTDLAPLDHAENFYATIAAALGMVLTGKKDVKSQVLDHLKKKKLLLILDNFEQVIEAVDEIAVILRTALGTQIVVTSREALDLQSEWLFEVQGLPVPEAIGNNAEPVSAVDLFVQRLQQQRSGLAPSPGDYDDILQICRLVNGLPLAIELAASLIRNRTLAEIATAVAEDLDNLSVSTRDLPVRQRSLRAIFEYSWGFLSEQEKIILSRLSVFRGSFATVAASVVASTTDMQLTVLYDKSFLSQPVPSRYEMHQVLQQFAIEKAKLLGVDQETRDKHSDYFLDFIAQRERSFYSPEAILAAAEIQNELANIRKAWEWATERVNAQALERSWKGLARFFGRKGLLKEGDYYFGKAVDNLKSYYGSDKKMPLEVLQLLSRLKTQQAQFLNLLARYSESIKLAQEVISLSGEDCDPVAVAMGYHVWGSALSNQGQGDKALEVLTQGLQISQEAKLDHLEAVIRSNIGVIFLRQGDFEMAENHFEEARTSYNQSGDMGGQATINNNLAILQVRQGKYKLAQQYYEYALEIYRQLGERGGEGLLLANLGIVASHQGAYSEAESLIRQALIVSRQTGERWLESALLNTLGSIRLRLGDYENARTFLEESYEYSREIGNLYSESESLTNLGMLACQEDDYESALSYSRQGLDAARAAGDQTLTSYAWMGRGRAQEGLGRLQAAADTYEQVLDLRLKGGPLSLIIEVRAGLARIALAEGNLQEAMEQVNSFADILVQPGDDGHVLDGAEEPLRIYYTTYHVLRAADDERSSMFQEAAVALLKSRATQIADPDLRKSYLRNVAVHRQIMGDLAASYA